LYLEPFLVYYYKIYLSILLDEEGKSQAVLAKSSHVRFDPYPHSTSKKPIIYLYGFFYPWAKPEVMEKYTRLS
jgi:hypothetical protein